MAMKNWDKNHLGVKRVNKMNQSQNKHKMTGMHPTLNFTLVKYSSNPEQLPSCSMVSFTAELSRSWCCGGNQWCTQHG
ncbi:hypothetical protein RRG08_049537 [Elysia crispata]|uniref:Uncharacterized protein n=1 Tax=Elysia crispata TaxID=231223 RepID=A0AAE1DAU1_9GAST|nr:hypothetical protein RRG08_049537 [Elysia crispata]